MLQSLKKISWILLLASAQQAAWAFSLGGPINNGGDSWQAPEIGYGLPGDLTAPKNLGEEYRRNTPMMYYSFDANFLDFFGSNGVVAVSQAFAVLNSSLTNVDAYSSGLTEFPMNSQAINYTASALGLADLKSFTMGAMMEQLGLTEPVRYAWTLHDRALIPGGQCPVDMVYSVVQRNFDITASPLNQVQYSPYVNGTLWSYYIVEFCTPPNPLALAYPYQVDPLADGATAVAANVSLTGPETTYQYGGFYTGLTRDDEAGLRYLLSTNNINFETPVPGSILLSSTVAGGTNYGAPFPLYTFDLNAFVWASLTNSPVILSNLYPGLIITSSSNYYLIQYTTNLYAYYTNYIGAPAGSQKLVTGQTVTWALATNYYNTYANIVTNTYRTNSTYTLVTIQAQQLNGAPAGTIVTNTSTSTVNVPNVPSGDFYINTNTCGPDLILSTLFTNVVATTNLSLVATNASGTNLAGLYYSQTEIAYATNHILLVEPIICGAAATGGTNAGAALYQGIGGMHFVQANYDSLLGQFFQPITNNFSMVSINNSKAVNQTYQRVVTAPDFVFSATDLAFGPAVFPPSLNIYSRNVNFNQGNILPTLAGPGTIDPATTIAFNKSGQIYFNTYLGNESTQQLLWLWGSFDGTTNDPVVYPNGTSIANLANQVLVQITPATLPNGTNGVAYPIQSFAITGGAFTAPYTWSLASGALPPGLKLNADGTITSPTSNVTPGKPTLSGTFDFTVQLTDVLSRSVTWNYTLTIN